MTQDLERQIAELIARKYAAPEGSAERRMALRQLVGLRSSYAEAGPIMEELDPYEWGSTDPLRPEAERPASRAGSRL